MSENTPIPDPAALRRKKLIGRAVVIGLLALIALYLVPMFLSLRH